jgi:hypothetical protein
MWLIRYSYLGSYAEMTVPGDDIEDAICVATLRLEAQDVFGAKVFEVREVRK